MTYELYSLHSIDAAKFYAGIAPLLNELNDLLKAKAEAARHGSNTYEVDAARAVCALFCENNNQKIRSPLACLSKNLSTPKKEAHLSTFFLLALKKTSLVWHRRGRLYALA